MNYNELCEKLNSYKNKFKVRVIGKSYFKRKIFAVEKVIDKNLFTAIFVCSVHARENIATDMVCKMIDDGLFEDINQFNLSFVLMLNPDGVELCEKGILSAPKKYRKNLIKINKNSTDFSLFKANGRGVDINNNFDARFATNINSTIASSSGYVGPKKESERETKAIVKYLKKTNPFFVINYHTKGEEIYFNFFQDKLRLKRDGFIADRFSKSTGYVIKNPENLSSGGLKDYCVDKLKIPSLTIELGSDNLIHPIKKEYLHEIYNRNKSIANDLNFAYNIFEEYRNKYGI